MRTLLLFIASVVSIYCTGQTFQAHISTGLANYVGDIQQRRLNFGQTNPVISLGASYNLNEDVAIRADFTTAKLSGDDKKSNTVRNIRRNLDFKTNIQEFTLTVEYDVYTFHEKFTPYLFAGLGVFHFNPYTYDSANTKVYLKPLSTEGQGINGYGNYYSLTQLNIPFGGGLKYRINKKMKLSFEVSLRKLFTDYIDDVSRTYADRDILTKERGSLAVQLAFRGDEVPPYNAKYPKGGSARGKDDFDWYYFTQIRFIYSLPWFKH